MLYSIVKPNNYQDSLRLMRLSTAVADMTGVDRVSVMMGTEMNKDYLRRADLTGPEVEAASPTDLLVCADVTDAGVGRGLLAAVEEFLVSSSQVRSSSGLRSTRSLTRAVSMLRDANLALISIPGEYVAAEADRLLDENLHLFIFSDNVSIDDEVAIKTRARDRGLLVMGPDCGTGSIDGLPLAFANSVRAGNIGLVGASGTGLQEVMTQIDRLRGGISQVIGLGGRDLSERVGGITCLQALAALDGDPATEVIVLVSKPPAPVVRDHVISVAQGLSKPVVVILLGEPTTRLADGNVHFVRTLDAAARVSVELAGTTGHLVVLRPEQRWIKGLYTGGTLAAEAALLIRESLDIANDGEHHNGYLLSSGGHEVIDLGDDAYTRGRPHPMIDPTVRIDRLPAVFDDPENAVLLLDLVLGYGSNPDPADAIAPTIAAGLARVRATGRELAVVASVCGSESDPQSLSAQTRTLEDAGVTVMPSNAAAVHYALNALDRGSCPRAALPAPDNPGQELLAGPPRVINIGLRSFAEEILAHGGQVVQCDWAPRAGGDRRLQALIDQLR
jgi:FdrA protein